MNVSYYLRSAFVLFFCTLLLPSLCAAQTGAPPQSKYFSTLAEERYSTYQLPGNGDLWPSCWAADGNVYAANGDGTAFGTTATDMAVSRISGMPPNLSGTTLTTNVGTDYSGPNYNRKPTGMLCRGGAIYLAFQNLNFTTFDDAPAASIAKSMDQGETWTWDNSAPMFGTPSEPATRKAYKFTTIFFLDYGKDSQYAIDNYVYAYGLDNNWRGQQMMYLARVPADKVQKRAAWEFYTGGVDTPTWSSDITQKVPVLTDTRLLDPVMTGTACGTNQTVIAQGGVTYDAPLKRYIFTSWSCSTHEFYDAPQPWGPWKHIASINFGPFQFPVNRGQYGPSIPSKYISADGKTLYLQSNVCCSGDSYTFSLRKVYVEPDEPTIPINRLSSDNLAVAPGARAIARSTHFGTICGLNCADQMSSGATNVTEDDFDEVVKTSDWWGYIWPRTYNINRVVYETGNIFVDGGWYAAKLRVQVRQNFKWVDVEGATVTPIYPYSNQAGAFTTYTFSFPNISGDGVRITGRPGGTSYFTSMGQLAVYYQSAASSQ